MSQKNRVRFLIARFCLLTYLLAWMGGACNLYGFLMILDDSHKLVFAVDGNKIQVFIHHTQNQEHDYNHLKLEDRSGHEHNSADNINNNNMVRQTDDPDEEIFFSQYQQQIPLNTKKTILAKKFSHLISILPFLDFHTSGSPQSFQQHTAKDSPILANIRTTVLLI